MIPPSLAAHPHTKLATLVYCEGLCIDVALVQEMLNGDTGPALVGCTLAGSSACGTAEWRTIADSCTTVCAGPERTFSVVMQVALLDPSSKDPSLRLRAANLLGLLVRHASSINSRLADAGVAQALAACIRQMEDSQLQRRAAAALGELLFYADSQRRDAAQQLQERSQGATPGWDLSQEAVQRLAGLLQPDQDEIAQVIVRFL
jgi:hypothetical protein